MKQRDSKELPRVLHLTTTAMSLGWLLKPQLHAFAEAGFEVITASAPGAFADELTADGIAHIPIPGFERSVDLAADIRAARQLKTVIADVAPDILHTHNPKPGVLGRVLGRIQRVPAVVNTVHGLYAQPTDGLARRLAVYGAERFAATCSDAELVQSIEDVDTLRRIGVPPQRVHLLGNGIDLQRFRKTPHGRAQSLNVRAELGIGPKVPVVGVIGRLVWEKGYRDLFDAIRLLRSSACAPFAVVVVGPREPGKADAIGDHDIAEMESLGVHFLGARNDIETMLEMFDLFVLGSKREGFPRAAMEACAMGLPVIATNVRGCRQVVEHQHNGLLYEPGSVRQLATAIERLLDDDLARRRFGSAGVVRAQVQFDQQRVIDRTLAVYRSLIGEATERYTDSIISVATDASNLELDLREPAANLSRSA